MDYCLDINSKNMRAGLFGIFPAALLVCVMAMFSFSTTVHAQCTNPAGAGGDILYNVDNTVLQYCDNTDWIGIGGGGVADNLGDHTATQALDMGSNLINNVTDPVGAQDAATKAYVDSLTGTNETDPQVNTLTEGKWCYVNGGVIDCTQDPPSGGGSCSPDMQTFDNSGTWTKPACGSTVKVECWGGGGGGAGSGGGGGGGAEGKRALFPYSSVGATETVTIGNRGTGASPGVNGGDGGSSSFGSLLTAAGGMGGLFAGGNGAGGGSVGPGSFPGADGQPKIGGSINNNGGGAGMGGGPPSRGKGVVPGGGGQGRNPFGQPGGKGRCIISTW